MLSWMKDTETALREINEALKRTYELTQDAANGTKTGRFKENKRRSRANKRTFNPNRKYHYAGRHVFSGYKTDEKLFDEMEIII